MSRRVQWGLLVLEDLARMGGRGKRDAGGEFQKVDGKLESRPVSWEGRSATETGRNFYPVLLPNT